MQPWQFDEEIAEIYDVHVTQHIPLYHETIDWCIDFAKRHVPKDAAILDFGCATGCTLRKLKAAGFTNLWGSDISPAMWHDREESGIHYSQYPHPQTYALILANWTLHFNDNKWQHLEWLKDHSKLLIVSEKCTQTDLQKQLYREWKLDQGVTLEEIESKELRLLGRMWLDDASAYQGTLIHSKLQFNTWMYYGKHSNSSI